MCAEYSHKKTRDRLKRAKSEISHNRISTETLKNEFRATIFNRLRITRSKSVDRFRQIVEDYGNKIEYRSINELREILLQDKEASNLLQTEEVSQLLHLIEQELEQVHLSNQGEDYITTAEKETEDMVNRLLNICQICGRIREDSICANCVLEFSNEFK